jgi:ketosteroid isomerase-like protein
MADDREAAVELLNRLTATFNEGGWDALEPFLDPEFEFHEPPEQPAPRVFHGPEEALEGWRGWSEAWAEQRSKTKEIIELPDGRYLVLTEQYLRARDGLEITQPSANVVRLRGERILSWESFWEQQTALESVELPPDSPYYQR